MARKLRFEARTATEAILRYLYGGFLAFLLLTLWLALRPGAWDGGGLAAYALLHLDVLGWVTTVMLGVYLNLLPVTLPGARVKPSWASLFFWPYALGMVSLILGFASGSSPLLAGAGVLLPVALLALGLHLLWGVFPVRSEMLRRPTALSYLLAPLSLAAAGVLGGLMALALAGLLPPTFLGIVRFHLLLALGGWLGLTVMGSAYRLVPFFFAVPSPRDEPLWGSLAVLLWGGGLLLAGMGWRWGLLFLILGALLFFVDMARMMAAGQHRKLEPVLLLTAISLGLFLGAALLAGVASTQESPWPWLRGALYIALYLAPSLLIFAQLSRILVFLTTLDLLQRKGIRTDRRWNLSRPRLTFWGAGLFLPGGLAVALGALLPEWAAVGGGWLQLAGGLLLMGSLFPALWARRLLRD